MTEDNSRVETKFCPRCALEKIKSELKQISNDIFECVKCSWLESDISTKITAPFKCPRCALEGIKSDLKNYPNHLLTCGKCQFVGKKVGGAIVQALI